MARGDKGTILSGFHGRLDDLIVIKQRNGKPVMCFYPKGKKVKWTENQKKHRIEFQFAIRYARLAIKDPVKLAFYEAREHDGINAYNLAISDYMHKPEIISIDIRKARGCDQYLIRVRAMDDFIVTQVRINLIDLTGNFKQVAPTQFRHTDLWIYRISCQKLSTLHAVKAFAYDNTGNHTMKLYQISPEESLNRLPHSYNKATG